ncbi:MAG: B12-binding domain-containing radical SAM protein [Mucilaginibacter sp.]
MSSSRIIFTHSYFLRFDPKQWALQQPYPPLATIYGAALMRENGYEVSLFDTMLRKDPQEIVGEIDRIKPEFFVIYDDGFNYLTKMCLTNMREAAFEMCRLASMRGCKVIVSSSDATDHYEKYLNAGADFVITGEGEMTLLELVNHIKDGGVDYGEISGIIYRIHGNTIKNPQRPVLRELDNLPFPAWDLIDIDQYRKCWMESAGYFSMNMVTTRGCPFKCNWCAKPIYGNRYNSHSPGYVVRQIKMLKENYHIDHIWFCDDIFGLKPGWILEFARLLKEENLKIRFKIQSRADLLDHEETVAALADAGCENVWIGAESGSQKILDAMDKGITVGQISTATGLMKKHGIKPSFFIQFGYPGEDKQDINSTIDMINNLLPYEIGISVSYPLPGTVFYERVKTELQKKTNWTDSDEMALMFKNTFPAPYYKRLHSYVHKNYHKHLAQNSWHNLFREPLSTGIGGIRKALSLFYYTPAVFIERLKLNRLERV